LFRNRNIVPLVTISHPSPRTVAPPPCLPLDIKDLLKEDTRFLDEGRFLDVGGFLLKEFLAEGKLLEGGLLKGEMNG
jgi:hypothetical protein